jgi:hypothetical protein
MSCPALASISSASPDWPVIADLAGRLMVQVAAVKAKATNKETPRKMGSVQKAKAAPKKTRTINRLMTVLSRIQPPSILGIR